MSGWLKKSVIVSILVLVYALLANARTVVEVPFVEDTYFSPEIIVPVLAGILLGPRMGLATGLFGPAVTVFTPSGSDLDLLAIAPYALMGYVAGFANRKFPTPVAVMSLALGHVAYIGLLVLFGKMEPSLLIHLPLWYGILYETFIEFIAIFILIEVYRLAAD